MEIRISVNIAISAWENGKKIGRARHFENVEAEIPHRVKRVCNIIGANIAHEAIRKNHSPENWADIINANIADAKLKAWVGAVVYWDYCNDPDDKGWDNFKMEFVEKYDFYHKLTENDLYAGLTLIGYEYAKRKRIMKDDKRLNRFVHRVLKKYPLKLTKIEDR